MFILSLLNINNSQRRLQKSKNRNSVLFLYVLLGAGGGGAGVEPFGLGKAVTVVAAFTVPFVNTKLTK